MPSDLFAILLPFFGLIGLGYLAGKIGWIQQAGVSGINAFVVRFAMPCLIIKVIAEAEVSAIFNLPLLLAYLGAEAVVYLASMLITLLVFRRSLAEAALLGMATAWGNVGYMGIPLAASLFGAEGALPALLVTAADMIFVTGVTVVLVEYDRKRSSMSLGPLLVGLVGKLVSHPFIITIVIGLGLSLTGWGIPPVLTRSVDFLSGAAGPSALFAIGASLAVRPLRGERSEIIAPIALKLLALPLLFYVFGVALGLSGLWLTAGVLLCALPTAGNVFVLAEQADAAVQRVSAIILVSTLLSILSVVLLLTYVL